MNFFKVQAAQQAAQVAALASQVTALSTQINQQRSAGGAEPYIPVKPLPMTVGPKAEHDMDGNYVGWPANVQNANHDMGCDYAGMDDTKEARARLRRIMGTDQLDVVSENIGSPEEASNNDSITINGTVIKTAKGSRKVVVRPTSDRYAYNLWHELDAHSKSMQGVFDPASPGYEWAQRVITVCKSRIVYLLSMDDYLTLYKVKPVDWAIAWRLKLRTVQQFRSVPFTNVGLDGDLLRYADTLGGAITIEQRGTPHMRQLVSQYFRSSMLDEIYESMALHLAAITPTPTPRAGAPGSVPSGGGEAPCILCGSTTCGGYTKPTYACKSKIRIPCVKCAEAGFSNMFHARVGHRATKVDGRVKTCAEHQRDASAKRAPAAGGASVTP